MSITEVIAAIGPENIRIQNIEQAMEGADYSKKKGGVTITFITQEVTVDDLMNGRFKKAGLILWFDRELWPIKHGSDGKAVESKFEEGEK